jgi:hypothetical protein
MFNRYYYKPDNNKEIYVEIKFYKDIKNKKIQDIYLY